MSSQQLVEQVVDRDDSGSISLSRRLVRSLSQRLKRKNSKTERNSEEEDAVMTTGLSFRWLTLYGRGGGCKVSDESGGSRSRRRSNASDETDQCEPYAAMNQKNDEEKVNCFFIKEKFWRRHGARLLKFHQGQASGTGNANLVNLHLPEEILEMCLVRLPLTSLMNAGLVCKKWRSLTTSPRFLQMRREGSFQTPWLFLFGVVRDGHCLGEVHAFDVLQNQWHKIESEALRGRFLFSVTSVKDDMYIVGGCSSLTGAGKLDQSSCKTNKEVFVFNPLSKSSPRVASMNYARSSPVVGVLELSRDCPIVKNQQNQLSDRSFFWSRSDVYQDPHRLSVRRQLRRSDDEGHISDIKTHKCTRQKSEDGCKRFVVIAVGGVGSWDEPLDSAEIYDPMSNKWTEIQQLPVDFGRPYSGTICNGIFYVYSGRDKLAGYDVEKGYWIRLEATSPSLTRWPSRVHEYHPKLVSFKGRLLMLCVSWCEGDGQIGRRNKAVRKVWELDYGSLSWKESSVHPDAPMDWNAAFVSDEEFVFGVEMFKIFGRVMDFVTVFDGARWSHVSKNRVRCDMDATSCLTKSIVVLRL